MISNVLHIGITVKDLDKSIIFYRDILGLIFLGEILMEGESTDILFGRKNSSARVAYLKGDKLLDTPPIELIQFLNKEISENNADLFQSSISEICFKVDNIDKTYNFLKQKGVDFLSEPQMFDFEKFGFSKSKAVYFKDIDGNILELIEIIS